MIGGILVDVSGSMKQKLTVNHDFKSENAQLHINRAHAVFNTIFKIIKQENNDKDEWFALAFGLSDVKHEHCDLIDLFKQLSLPYNKKDDCYSMLLKYFPFPKDDENIRKHIVVKKIDKEIEWCNVVGHEPLLAMCAQNGAPYCGDYIDYVSKDDAGYIFSCLDKNRDVLQNVIAELPTSCKYKVGSWIADWHGYGNQTKKLDSLKEEEKKISNLLEKHEPTFIEKYVLPLFVPEQFHPVNRLKSQLQVVHGTQKKTEENSGKTKKEVETVLQKAKNLIMFSNYPEEYQPRIRRDIIDLINKLLSCYATSSDSSSQSSQSSNSSYNINLKYNNNYYQINSKDSQLESKLNENKHSDDCKNANNDTWNIDKLMDDIEPYIYGKTPMCKSLQHATTIFKNVQNNNKKKNIVDNI